jgi:hypothetical protein
MSDPELDDPLSIAKCKDVTTAFIPPPKARRLAKSRGDLSYLLDSEPQLKERSISLKVISKQNRQAFESDMPNPPHASTPVPSLIVPDLRAANLEKPSAITHDFSQFIVEETLYKNLKIADSMRDKRKQLFERHILTVERIREDLKVQLNESVLLRSDHHEQKEQVYSRILSLRRIGIESQRVNAAIHIIYHQTQMKLYQVMSKRLQRTLELVISFLEFLSHLPETFSLLPQIDVAGFQKSFEKPDEHSFVLEKRVNYLRAHLKDLVEQKPTTGDWFFDLLHPQTKTGQVIQRFEERIESLGYEDVLKILKHLAKGKPRSEFHKLEALLFDLAWSKRPYPFGFSGTKSVPGNRHFLPVKGDLFPAVIGADIVDPEFGFTPFSTLNGLNWPFKSAVDMIFEMMILTNPFDIARVYWNVIQNVAECMQRVLVLKGMNKDDVEIDFDSLFPTLMVCVFAFGIDEWMQVSLYAISFNEHVMDDPQLQFTMTYLEGLVTQIIALDKEALKRKATDLRRVWADEQTDPLGLD